MTIAGSREIGQARGAAGSSSVLQGAIAMASLVAAMFSSGYGGGLAAAFSCRLPRNSARQLCRRTGWRIGVDYRGALSVPVMPAARGSEAGRPRADPSPEWILNSRLAHRRAAALAGG